MLYAPKASVGESAGGAQAAKKNAASARADVIRNFMLENMPIAVQLEVKG
jgi:hypothetical protein